MTSLQLKFEGCLANVVNDETKIAVAWSGGADSTALLLRLKEEGFDVVAWHVDHGWHAQSSQHAEALKRKAKVWGVPFESIHFKKPKRNLEAESRRLRYDGFVSLAKNTGIVNVVLGHHADDQAETVCMRLLQGSGIAGCQGMRSFRKHHILNIWRPFLHVTKKDIESYLIEKDFVWLQDSSNNDLTIWRNKIRHTLFSRMRDSGVEPRTLFMRYQKQAERVQSEVEGVAEGIAIEKLELKQGSQCVMDWNVWIVQREPVRVYLLQKMIGILFADGKVFGRRHIEAIEQWKQHGGNGWVNLSGCCLYKQGDSLRLCQGNKIITSE